MATVPETPVPPSDLAQQTTKNIIIIKFKKGIKEADAEAHMKTVQERNEKSQQPGLSTPGIQTRFKTIFYGYQGTFNPDVETFIRGDKVRSATFCLALIHSFSTKCYPSSSTLIFRPSIENDPTRKRYCRHQGVIKLSPTPASHHKNGDTEQIRLIDSRIS